SILDSTYGQWSDNSSGKNLFRFYELYEPVLYICNVDFNFVVCSTGIFIITWMYFIKRQLKEKETFLISNFGTGKAFRKSEKGPSDASKPDCDRYCPSGSRREA
ncbi:MAG: hypothetical protein ACI4D3_11100, partial [Lachnospiraceae bacterium]